MEMVEQLATRGVLQEFDRKQARVIAALDCSG
jgi:hypothetical protein